MKLSRAKAARLLRSLPQLFLLICAINGMTGCVSGSRVVFIDNEAALIRLGPDVEGHVYWLNAKGEWELSRGKVKIPEGFFAGPMKAKNN